MTDKWRPLLDSMVVEGSQKSHCTTTELQLFESHARVKLPAGSGGYCEVFGSGELNHCVRIWCPMSVRSKFDLRLRWLDDLTNLTEVSRDNSKMLVSGAAGIDETQLKRVLKLLETAFPFGDTCDTDVFAFDLSSFREADQSYDIYGIFEGFDVSPYCCLVGRDFYRFVTEFVLGDAPAKNGCLSPHFVKLWREGAAQGRSFYRLV